MEIVGYRILFILNSYFSSLLYVKVKYMLIFENVESIRTV